MLLIENMRNGYTPEQCGDTITAGDLIEFLAQLDEYTPIYISNDSGYTFSSITEAEFIALKVMVV